MRTSCILTWKQPPEPSFISELDVAKEKTQRAIAMEIIVGVLLVVVAFVFVGIAMDAARADKGRG